MSELRTPDGIIRELSTLLDRKAKGVEELRKAEERLLELRRVAERAELKAYTEAGGTVADRQAVAKLASEDERWAAELAKIQVSYMAKLLDNLRDAQMNLQTQARLVEAIYRGAGIGER